MKSFGTAAALLSALLWSTSAVVQAESMHPQLDAKHTFMLGGYKQKADAEFYANPDNHDRAKLSLGDLGVDDTDTSFMLEYRYRFSEKWLFAVSSYRFETSGTIEAKRDFEYDDVPFEAGASLDTGLDVDTYMIEALYSVYKTDRAEIMVGGGLHMFDFNASLQASAFVGDQERGGSRASDDILAPLPNLRAQGFYALSPKWGLVMTMGWLSANYEDYDGSFAYIHARTMYRFVQGFSVGVGYQYLDVDLTVDRSHGEAGFDIEFKGPAAYLAYSF